MNRCLRQSPQTTTFPMNPLRSAGRCIARHAPGEAGTRAEVTPCTHTGALPVSAQHIGRSIAGIIRAYPDPKSPSHKGERFTVSPGTPGGGETRQGHAFTLLLAFNSGAAFIVSNHRKMIR